MGYSEQSFKSNSICANCGGSVEQTGRGRPRRFCKPECGAAYWNKQNAAGPDAPRSTDHKVTDVDPETRMGHCSQCGPNTRVYQAGARRGGRWRCRNRVRAQPSVQVRPRIAELEPGQREVMQVRKMRGNGIDITVEQWTALKAAADGRCQLCSREAELQVDHNHSTREPRGLLCSTCNTGLGKLGDGDEARLLAALEYVRNPPARAVGSTAARLTNPGQE